MVAPRLGDPARVDRHHARHRLRACHAGAYIPETRRKSHHPDARLLSLLSCVGDQRDRGGRKSAHPRRRPITAWTSSTWRPKPATRKTKMLILCSPHNPVGRVWKRDELTRLAEICRANDVLVVSDEIHADLTFTPFTPYGTLGDDFTRSRSSAPRPAKTFNLAGLGTSNIIIPNRGPARQVCEIPSPKRHPRHGFLRTSRHRNRLCARRGLARPTAGLPDRHPRFHGKIFRQEHIPQIRMIRPEGTYLVWLDCRALGLDSAVPVPLLPGQGAGLPGKWRHLRDGG